MIGYEKWGGVFEKRTLLVSVQALGEDVVPRHDHDDGQVLVNQCQHAVLQLAGHDSLTVEVANLLNLKGTLESCTELAATTEQQQGLLILEHLLAKFLDSVVLLQHLLDLLGDIGQALHDLDAPLLLASTVLAEGQREHNHSDELGGVCLGGSDTDLGAGVDVDTAVGQHTDRATDHVHDTDSQCATLQAVSQGHQRISRLARLRDEHASVVTEHRGLPVEEVGRQLDRDRNLCELLEDTTNRHTAVVRGTAGNEYDTPASADGAHVCAQTTERDGLVLNVQTTTHGVDDGLGLLEDLLLHEVVELALHDLLELELKGLDGANVAAAIGLFQAVDVEGTLVDVGNVVILQVHNLLGVLDDSRRVGREEELGGHGHAIVGHESPGLGAVEEGLVGSTKQVGGQETVGGLGGLLHGNILGGGLGRESAGLVRVFDIDKVDLHAALGLDTNDEGGTLSGSHNLVRVVDRLDEQTICTLELGDDSLGQVDEAQVGVVLVDVLCQLGNALGVCLGLELVALGSQESLKLLVVCDDTVVDNSELPVGVGSVADGPG